MMSKIVSTVAALGLMAGMVSSQAMAATTGLGFAGGCPESVGAPFCAGGSNATVTNVAEILGVDVSLVTQVAEVTGSDGTAGGLTITGINAFSGTWSISDPSITHIAFKSDGYFILGAVTVTNGVWMNDTTPADSWDLSLATCPGSICGGGGRAYVDLDFRNNGGNVAALSNARAFTVVPVPAAVWLFGSGLMGLAGIARRKRG